MTKKETKRILRIVLLIGSITSLVFVPWILVKAWILPIPDTVQEQVNEAIGHGFDGMIVYVDQSGKQPELYTSGWHNRADGIPAVPNALFKIASISKLYVLLLPPNWQKVIVCLWIVRSLITCQNWKQGFLIQIKSL